MALTKITTSVVAVNSLTTANIADNSIDATKIASNSILTRHIDDAQITTDQILDGTIATADIADDAVTEDKLANAINTSIAAKAPLATPQFTNRVGIGVAAHGTAALNITSTAQHVRLNNGSELGIISLESDGALRIWSHGDSSNNEIEFYQGSGSGAASMTINGSGNVGIGSSSPSAFKLLLEGTDSQEGLMIHAGASSSQWLIRAEDNAGNQRFVVKSTGDAYFNGGNVGIGTDNPGVILDILTATANTNGVVRIQNNMDNNYEALRIHSLGNYDAQMSFLAQGDSTYWGGFGIDYSDAGKFKLQTDNLFVGGSNLMTWARDGKVGIGTSSPSQKFEVFPDDDHAAIIGRAKVGNLGYSDFAGFAHLDSGSQYAILQHNTGETYVNAASGYPINFRINNANIGRIDTDGLKFGTDTAAANALDDYEEGTWTPAYNNGGSISYATRYGSYVKIGRLVHLACNIDVNTVSGTNAGAMQITGAPFTNDGVDETGGSVGINLSGWLNGSGSDTIQINATDAVILPSKDTKNDIYRGTDIGTGFVRWSIVYMTDE